jgi:hypothetical protein
MAKKTRAKKAGAKKPARKSRASAARARRPARKAASKTRRAAGKARRPAPRSKSKAKVAPQKRVASPRRTVRANEGEGSRTADQRYRDAATRFSTTHDTIAIAERAAREVDASPHEYDDAENEGLSHSAGDLPQDEY